MIDEKQTVFSGHHRYLNCHLSISFSQGSPRRTVNQILRPVLERLHQFACRLPFRSHQHGSVLDRTWCQRRCRDQRKTQLILPPTLMHHSRLIACFQLMFTPLHSAAQQGHVMIVKLLLENGASPNKTNKVRRMLRLRHFSNRWRLARNDCLVYRSTSRLHLCGGRVEGRDRNDDC